VHSVDDCGNGLLGCSDSPTECPAASPAEFSFTSEACPMKCPADDPAELSEICLMVECSECSAGDPAGANRRL